jgi:ribose 5-phosphate isomerase B
MKIAIGSDHAGIKLKDKIKKSVADIEFIDVGAFSEESTDYPDHIAKVALAVQSGSADLGIGICGTGIGASIVANKFNGIRAALCTNEFMAEMSRRHNNSNILILGARITDETLSVAIVKKWLETPFEGGRHQRRLDKISSIEDGCFID